MMDLEAKAEKYEARLPGLKSGLDRRPTATSGTSMRSLLVTAARPPRISGESSQSRGTADRRLTLEGREGRKHPLPDSRKPTGASGSSTLSWGPDDPR
jgi:hypothetical protein